MSAIIVPIHAAPVGGIPRPAEKRNFLVSNKDEVGSSVIALDGSRGILLYTRKTRGNSVDLIVDLNNVETCGIKKEYNSINAGELKKKKLHHFLKSIKLILVFKDKIRSVSLPFFDAQNDRGGNLEIVETKAEKWRNMVTNLLTLKMAINLENGLGPI